MRKGCTPWLLFYIVGLGLWFGIAGNRDLYINPFWNLVDALIGLTVISVTVFLIVYVIANYVKRANAQQNERNATRQQLLERRARLLSPKAQVPSLGYPLGRWTYHN